MKDDGTFIESRWIDEDRLEVINPDEVLAISVQTNGPDKAAPRR